MTDSTHAPGALAAYTGDRPEVRALVPGSSRRVLDLGCATGALGAALKAGQEVEVVGVEIDPGYANEAAARLDRVVVGSAAELPGDLGSFDCLIAADVLEHLPDPWAALRKAAEHLDPGGSVVVSLPNVRFFETFWQLGVRGRWPRRDHGIFDQGHLRWFTRSDARELLEQAGLRIDEIHPVIRIRPRGSRFDRLFAWLGRTPLRELFAFQWLLVGRRTVQDPASGADLIP